MKGLAGAIKSLNILAAGVIVVLTAIALGHLRGLLPAQRYSLKPPLPAPSHSSTIDPTDELSTLDPRLAAARSALLRHNFAAALRLTDAVKTQGPEKTDALLVKATIFKETDYQDREIETLRHWTQTAPQDARPWIKLFYLYLDLGWTHEAEQASKHAIEISPSNSRSHAARAAFYYRSQSPELAIQHINDAVRLDPSNIALANLQESILIKARRFREAEAAARKTLAMKPESTADQLALYHALMGQGKSQEAEALLHQIQQREPENIEASYELGSLEEKHGDLTEATRQFEQVASHDHAFNNVLWRLGRLYRQQGRVDEGRKLMTDFEAMEKNTADYETVLSRMRTRWDDPGLHYQLAKFHLSDEEIPQAIVELRRVLELRPHDANARQDLTRALRLQGRLTEARQLAHVSNGQFEPQ